MSESKKTAHAPLDLALVAKNIVETLEAYTDLDIGTKMAACKAAAAIYEHSIQAQGMAVMLNNIIAGANK